MDWQVILQNIIERFKDKKIDQVIIPTSVKQNDRLVKINMQSSILVVGLVFPVKYNINFSFEDLLNIL